MSRVCFLYARKSSDSEERQVLSIEAQLAELKEFAQKENVSIKQIFTESQSAKTPGRPIFNEMIARIEKGEAQGIVAWHPDRLARNSVDGGRIVYLLDTHHIDFLRFPTFWFENTPQGKFMLNIAFGQSKYYVDNLSENVKRGLRQKIRNGVWPGYAPPGYLNDRNLKKVVPDPQTAPLIKKLFETYATGRCTLQDLKKISFEWGLVSRHGNKQLVKAAIQRTLKKSFYYGLMVYNGEAHQGIHEPLISKELFDQVQTVMAEKSRPKVHKQIHFPLLGLAHCQTCGCAITAERQKGHHYYRCTKKKGPCDQPYVREESLAEQITQAITNCALPKDGFDYMMSQLESERQGSSQNIAHKQSKLKNELSQLTQRLDRLLDAHINGALTQAEYLAKKEMLLNEKMSVEARISKLTSGAMSWLEPCNQFLQAAHQAHQLLQSENLEAKRDFFKKIGSNLLLSQRRLQFDLKSPWNFLAKNLHNFTSLQLQNSPQNHTESAPQNRTKSRPAARARKLRRE